MITIRPYSPALHPEDRTGEVYVLTVDPQFQRRGVGTALTQRSPAGIRRAAPGR